MPADFYEALKIVGGSYSALSWDGHNIFGNEEDIKYIRSLLVSHYNVEHFWRPEVIHLRQQVADLQSKLNSKEKSNV